MKILWRRVGMFGSEHLGLDDELDKIGGDLIVPLRYNNDKRKKP